MPRGSLGEYSGPGRAGTGATGFLLMADAVASPVVDPSSASLARSGLSGSDSAPEDDC
jgi:hypothetical protein